MVAFRLPRAGEVPSLWSRTIDRPGGQFYGRAALRALLLVLVAGLLLRGRRGR